MGILATSLGRLWRGFNPAGRGRHFPLTTEAPLPLPGPWPRGLALARYSRRPKDEGGERTAVGDLLSRFKYGGEAAVVRALAEALARALRADPCYQDVEVVVHVPATIRRDRPEPASELARATARALRLRCLPRLLAPTGSRSVQKDLATAADKQRNVDGAFRLRRPQLIRGRKVLLIDDIYDSGATLAEAWRAVMASGAREVVVAAFAKTGFQGDA